MPVATDAVCLSVPIPVTAPVAPFPYEPPSRPGPGWMYPPRHPHTHRPYTEKEKLAYHLHHTYPPTGRLCPALTSEGTPCGQPLRVQLPSSHSGQLTDRRTYWICPRYYRKRGKDACTFRWAVPLPVYHPQIRMEVASPTHVHLTCTVASQSSVILSGGLTALLHALRVRTTDAPTTTREEQKVQESKGTNETQRTRAGLGLWSPKDDDEDHHHHRHHDKHRDIDRETEIHMNRTEDSDDLSLISAWVPLVHVARDIKHLEATLSKPNARTTGLTFSLLDGDNMGTIPPGVLRSWMGLYPRTSTDEVHRRLRLVPSLLRRRLLPFQEAALRFGLMRGGRMLLADEMGAGKSVQALALATCYRDEWPLLLIVPASMRLMWADVLEIWLPNIRPQSIQVIDSCASAHHLLHHPAGQTSSAKNHVANEPEDYGGSSAAARSPSIVITSYDMVRLLACDHCRRPTAETHPSTRPTAALPPLPLTVRPRCTNKHATCIVRYPWGVVIADESHTLRSGQEITAHSRCRGRVNDRTLATLAIVKSTPRAILLTGTPSLSKPFDLHAQVDALRPGLLGDATAFGRRYCLGYRINTVRDYDGPSGRQMRRVTMETFGDGRHLQELHVVLRREVMLRRLKEEVMAELPPLRRELVHLRCPAKHEWPSILKGVNSDNDDRRNRRRTRVSAAQNDDLLGNGDPEVATQATTNDDDDLEGDTTQPLLQSSLQLSLNAFDASNAYHRVGLAKVATAVEWLYNRLGLTDEVQDGKSPLSTPINPSCATWLSIPKTVIFAHHIDVMDLWHEKLCQLAERTSGVTGARSSEMVVRIDGSVAENDRFAACHRFNHREEVRFALVSVTAGGVGVNLSQASMVVFAELPREAGLVQQAEARAHRRGGVSGGVQVFFLVAANTVDDGTWSGLMTSLYKIQTVHNGRAGDDFLRDGESEGQEEEDDEKMAPRESKEEDGADEEAEVVGEGGEEGVRDHVVVEGAPRRDAPPSSSSPPPPPITVLPDPIPETQVAVSLPLSVSPFTNGTTSLVSTSPTDSQVIQDLRDHLRGQGAPRRDFASEDDKEEELILFEVSAHTGRIHLHGHADGSHPLGLSIPMVGATMLLQEGPREALDLLAAHNPGDKWEEMEEEEEEREKEQEEEKASVGGREVDAEHRTFTNTILRVGCRRRLSSRCNASTLTLAPGAAQALLTQYGIGSRRAALRMSYTRRVQVAEALARFVREWCELSAMQRNQLLELNAIIPSDVVLTDLIGQPPSGDANRRVLPPARTITTVEAMKTTEREDGSAELVTTTIGPPSRRSAGKGNADSNGTSASIAATTFAPFPAPMHATTERIIKAPGLDLMRLPPGALVVEVRVSTHSRLGQHTMKQGILPLSGGQIQRRCLYCAGPTKLTIPTDKMIKFMDLFCSQSCTRDYEAKCTAGGLRRQLSLVEKGVCQVCGLDTRLLCFELQKIRRNVIGWKEARARVLKEMAHKFFLPKMGKYRENLLNKAIEGYAWHADHVKAVYEGGGACSIDNMRTLCVPCHVSVTIEQHKARAHARKRARPQGQLSLLETLAKSVGGRGGKARTKRARKPVTGLDRIRSIGVERMPTSLPLSLVHASGSEYPAPVHLSPSPLRASLSDHDYDDIQVLGGTVRVGADGLLHLDWGNLGGSRPDKPDGLGDEAGGPRTGDEKPEEEAKRNTVVALPQRPSSASSDEEDELVVMDSSDDDDQRYI